MTNITLTLELHHNNRVTSGLYLREENFTSDYGFVVRPGSTSGKDVIEVTLTGLDFGRFDAEGDAYLCDFLQILPGDLIHWYKAEEYV